MNYIGCDFCKMSISVKYVIRTLVVLHVVNVLLFDVRESESLWFVTNISTGGTSTDAEAGQIFVN